ncbi:MAG TPA: XRE family transcriptional regulator [Scandinavium sp.]|jgi:transcriptional regulator with XRE-family HTH domain
MNIAQHLATTLKTLRQQREWSLSKLAEETGVSKAMLGQIERNESSPTVATLWKIATGLNVPFSLFITPAESEERAWDPQQQAMVVTPIFSWDPILHYDHFAITLAPGALSESTPHEAGVIEHVVAINGTLEMCIDGQWQAVNEGQGLRFAGDKPHAYRNRSARTVLFHSLIHYPSEQKTKEKAAD